MIFRGSRHIAFAHACKTFPARLPLDLRSLSTVNRNSALNRSVAITAPAKPTTPAVDFNDADMAFRVRRHVALVVTFGPIWHSIHHSAPVRLANAAFPLCSCCLSLADQVAKMTF
jgi:hypothetical protein